MPELVARRAVAVVLLLAVGRAALVASTQAAGPLTLAAPASPTTLPSGAADGAATRVAIPALGVDLPVVSSAVTLEGNEPGYPLCDVAQYSDQFEDPGRPGTTYIYAHARPNMLLPLLEASRVDAGRSLLGMDVLVYTNDAWLYTYRI
ncbi:MAG: hypothetical protein QFC55_09010, partial [Chloroflexota bacterium]|nr:hypothetical protein [Chloroflexota bacterium]